MSYANSTLLEVLNKIESHHICLPSIQRKFEWGMDRIEMLFDSILNDYPIGTFLIWNVSNDSPPKYNFFEINNAFDLNEGQWQKPRTNVTTYKNLWALLDGQQRLTSISIGLQGSYTYITHKKRITKHLFFNLIENNGSEDYKSFKFFEHGKELEDPDSIWIMASMFVNQLEFFHKGFSEDIEHYALIEKIVKSSIKYKNEAIKQLWKDWKEKNSYYKIGKRISNFAEKVGKDDKKIFSYYLINNSVDLDICNEIFVRINSGGVKLSKADLLFSTVVSSWEDGRTHVDDLIKLVKSKGFSIDTEFIMRVCLYLVNTDILFKVKSFNSGAIGKIISSFIRQDGETSIYQSIVDTFKFFENSLGFSDKILKSKNVIIPIVHHVFHGGTLKDDSVEEVQKYIYISLLQKVFGSHGDTLLKDLRKAVTNDDDSYKLSKKAFNYNLVISSISEPAKKRLFDVDLQWAEKLLMIEKSNDSWLVLSLIYGKLPYQYQSYDQDHLHPVSQFKKMGNYTGNLKKVETLYNTIPNLSFSTPNDNRLKKNAHPLIHYVEKILKENDRNWYKVFRDFNKIESDLSLELNDFDNFYETRKLTLIKILSQKLNLNKSASLENIIMEDNDYPDIEDDEQLVLFTSEIQQQATTQESLESKTEKSISERPRFFSEEENLVCKKLYKKLIEEKFLFMNGICSINEIYNLVKIKYPELCNDDYLCLQNCTKGVNQPEWKHRIRSAISALKPKAIFKVIGKEYHF